MTSTPRISVSISPHLTALAMISDALAGRRRGLPEVWREAVGSRVGPLGRQAVRPLAVPGHSVVPDSLVPRAPVGADITVPDQLAALRELPPGALVKDLEQAFGEGPPPPHWRSAAEHPTRWLHGYAAALADVWSVTEPLWRQARGLLDREVRRVGVAAVRGGPELLLGALNSRIVQGEGRLLISDLEPGTFDLGEREVVLVPMLAGKDALIVSLDQQDAVWIAYPVPGADSLWRRPTAPARDELSALMGEVRVDLLCSLGRPMTMSMLASGLQAAPSSITYHCDRLRAARLITRERRGREVWIARTDRGDELLELFRR
ncbi:ArsR/SmtB family transcription factor [Nonomuraea jiangxiensis]|uniref:HTH arsR-type domain-containing protein n=1 Tax=Nonomuraea jiangxiensis TaxID=633440 RepID=A0A1G8DQ89_9ACTN|nr:hypothetical protein [Nonomuraea jiangxiensis]SDH59828.1 hypothetical protein SAMN05421869_102640 [Nonomuraea jiangxiensis]